MDETFTGRVSTVRCVKLNAEPNAGVGTAKADVGEVRVLGARGAEDVGVDQPGNAGVKDPGVAVGEGIVEKLGSACRLAGCSSLSC